MVRGLHHVRVEVVVFAGEAVVSLSEACRWLGMSGMFG